MSEEQDLIRTLYKTWSQKDPESIAMLPGSGSYRHYYRITGNCKSVLGVYNDDCKENIAFLSFTESFHNSGFPVPEIFSADLENNCYLIEDLGDLTLFTKIEDQRKSGNNFFAEVIHIYHEILKWLPQFQVKGSSLINYKVCYPRAAFDRQSMLWDLNYFKYYFLKLAKVPFDEQKLEDDFDTLTKFLLEAGCDYFMYRDFQSRNIMVKDGKPWFIDYQGGRKGPLQYDLASLLYDAKAAVPENKREEFVAFYLNELGRYLKVDHEQFLHHYYGFVLIRILQALGTYGFRGYYENKNHFLQSIPFAMQNLEVLLNQNRITLKMPMLIHVLEAMIKDPRFTFSTISESKLTIAIYSFSYKKSIPDDSGGNGGGFIFDCRALPNPGKIEEYKGLTGQDQPVIDFLKKETSVDEFLNHVFAIVDQSVKRYAERDFTHLMVSFGCTGGQHRSVYCAEQMAKHILEKFPVKVILQHTQIQ